MLLPRCFNEGDEIVIPAPYWTTYPELAKLAGGVPVFIETDESTEFKVTVAMLDALFTPKTKALLFVSPSNPTGAVYSREEMEASASGRSERSVDHLR